MAFVDVFKVALGTHDHAAATCAVAVLDTGHAVDDGTCREIGRGHDFHQFINRGFGIAQQVQASVHHLVQVVRRDVGGHAHGNTTRAVDQQVGQTRGQNQGFFFGAVVVGAKVDGVLVDVAQHLVGDLGQADFGVTHGGRVVAVHRAEVALAIDQHVAHGKVLRHAHDGVVHRLVAVGVVFADHITHDSGRLFVGAVPVVVQLVHREQDPAVHGFQAVPGIGQGTPDNHAHGVIEVAAPHFLFQTDGQCFFGELGHMLKRQKRRIENQPF